MCIGKKIEEKSQISLDFKFCTPSLYLILEKDNKTENASFDITISNINTEGNEYCLPIQESSFITCGATPMDHCRKCKNNVCASIQCGKDVENPIDYIDDFQTYNELCIPRNISDKRKKNMCKNFSGVNTYRVFYECDYDIKYKFSFMTSEFYLFVVIIIIVFALIIIYYNNYLIKKKEKPFNVPFFAPEALFPDEKNINSEFKKMRNENNNGNVYYTGKYYNI